MPNEQEQDDYQRVKQAVETLSEFFDAVQIFASRYDPANGNTFHAACGRGNIFARQGQVQEWVNKPLEESDDDEGGE